MSEAEVKIHDVAFGGDGVGRLPDGRVVFVPRTLAGETVRLRIGRERKGFSEADLVEVLTPSPHRVKPPCTYFGNCGGCQYQHASYEEQMRIKQKQARDTLERIGGFKDLPPLHVEAAPSPLGYRNKISVHRGEDGAVGFYATDHHTVVDIERCLIANDVVNAQLAALRQSKHPPRHANLSDASRREGSPDGGFHQVNSEMAARLIAWVRGRFVGAQAGTLLDLYCGSGFFTLGLAEVFTSLCGADRNTAAIHSATLNAQKRGIENARFFAADISEKIGWLLEDASLREGVILVDPPREGLAPKVTEALSKGPSARLLYVSCDPSTLARDLKRLGAYAMTAWGIFDMFPQTAHIELAVELKRR